MTTHNPRPIIFPLSNPVALCELDYDDAIEWFGSLSSVRQILTRSFRTNGKVIFASGSPYQSVTRGSKRYEPGQGNNMYVFPGIGLGTILSRASRVTDTMIEQASVALAASLTEDEHEQQLVYPRVDRIRDISARVALAVIRTAQNAVRSANSMYPDASSLVCTSQNVDNVPELRHITDNSLLQHIKDSMWDPHNLQSRM